MIEFVILHNNEGANIAIRTDTIVAVDPFYPTMPGDLVFGFCMNIKSEVRFCPNKTTVDTRLVKESVDEVLKRMFGDAR